MLQWLRNVFAPFTDEEQRALAIGDLINAGHDVVVDVPEEIQFDMNDKPFTVEPMPDKICGGSFTEFLDELQKQTCSMGLPPALCDAGCYTKPSEVSNANQTAS